jgi:hypothetical protein
MQMLEKFSEIQECWRLIDCTFPPKDTAGLLLRYSKQLACHTMQTGKIQCRRIGLRQLRCVLLALQFGELDSWCRGRFVASLANPLVMAELQNILN